MKWRAKPKLKAGACWWSTKPCWSRKQLVERKWLVDLYISCIEWVILHTVDLEDGRVQLTMPMLKFILDSPTEHKVAKAKIASPVKTTISFLFHSDQNKYRHSTKFLHNLSLNGNFFRVYFKDKDDHELNYNKQVELNFTNNKVVAVDIFDEGKIGWEPVDTYDIRKFHGRHRNTNN